MALLPKGRNLFYLVDGARYTGCTPRSWHTLKGKLSPKLQRKVNENFADIPPVLLELQDAVHAHDARRVKKVLVRVAQRLFEGSSHSSTISTHNVSTMPLMAFVAWGGMDLVIHLLFLDEQWLIHSPPTALQIWNLCIKIATEIVMVDPTLSWYTFSREKCIVRRALKLLSFRVTFENAAVMCEQLLASIGPCVDLGSVCTDFSSLIVKMNDMQLALVCRVLALLVNPAWNVQVHDNSHKFGKLVARLKRVEALMQRNHDLVIDHPQILNRLVNLMKYQVSHLRSMQYGGSFALLLPVNTTFSLTDLQNGVLSASAHNTLGDPNAAMEEPMAPPGEELVADPPVNAATTQTPGPGIGNGTTGGTAAQDIPVANHSIGTQTANDGPPNQSTNIAATLASALLSALGPLPADADMLSEATQYQQASLPPVVSVQADVSTSGGEAGAIDLGPPTPSQSMTWFYNPSPQHCDALVEESLTESQEASSSASASCDAIFGHWGSQYSYKADTRFASTIDDALYGGIFGEEARSLSIVSCQSEVLFILSSLLSGRRSTEVWHRLSGRSILQVIFDTFDSIFTDKEPDGISREGSVADGGDHAGGDGANFWNGFTPAGSAPSPHPQDREAREHLSHQNHRHDPETLRKMEYLRLVHEYWDCRDVYELHDTSLSQHHACKRQLAEKLALRLVKQSEDPCTDNVLTYALEAFIRGTAFAYRQQEQEFLAGKILPHLVRVIAECKNENRLESEFSLLAEIIKFNPQTLHQLELALAADEKVYNGLVTVVCARPFHSNLFVRGLVLTVLSLQPTCSSLLIPRLRCCPTCQAKAETHRSEFWEPYSVFVERIQRAKEIVNRMRAKDPSQEIDSLLTCLSPEQMDRTTCTICFESILEPLPEEQDINAESPSQLGDGHLCDQSLPVFGSPLDQPPILSRLIYNNKIRMIRNLMAEITLPQVCRENMCCVTTTLVFFVVARHSSSLSVLLQQIKEYELQQAEEWCAQSGETVTDLYRPKCGACPTEVERMDPFRNFFELVCIWLAYYAAQRHYQDTLFYCTHIPMSAWRSTVRSLVDLLPQYYLIPDP
eukprot:EG_transcript_1301